MRATILSAMGASSREFLNERMNAIDELFRAEPERVHLIEQLLRTAALAPHELEDIDRELLGYIDEERAEELITYLYANQLDPISSGLNYSMTDINNKLNREI